MNRIARLLCIAWTFVSSLQAEPPAQKPLTDFSKLMDGDLIFIESSSAQASAIKEVTGSTLTHCGIVFKSDGGWRVLEGAGRGTNYLALGEWIDHESGTGPNHPIYVRRLLKKDERFAGGKLDSLKQRAKKLHETRYDFGFAWENKDRDTGKEYIYCSELLWKAFNDAVGVQLGTPHALEDYITMAPNAEAKTKRKNEFDRILNSDKSKERRNGIPYNLAEKTISPVEVFNSAELEAVTD